MHSAPGLTATGRDPRTLTSPPHALSPWTVGLLERTEIELRSNRLEIDTIKKCITSGFFYHTAKLQKNGAYKTVKNPQTVHIHPSSGLVDELPKWIVYFELVFTTKEYMRQVIEIKPEWLAEIAPHYYKKKDLEVDTCARTGPAPATAGE